MQNIKRKLGRPRKDAIPTPEFIQNQRSKVWGETYLEMGDLIKQGLGLDVSSTQFNLIMVLLKARRFSNSGNANRDCLVDMVNYAKLALDAFDKGK